MRYFLLFILLSNQSFCQTPIDKTEIITIGGIKQYVRIKGKDSSKPLLLFLHGGPGSSVLNKADHMTGKLQQQFVVVHWDQRETGETLRLNKSSQPLTLRLFYNDTHDLIDSLLKRFQRPKLYLAGYSWGSGLGFYVADKYPALLYAYIAISPVINQWESEKIALELLRERMGRKAQKELAQVKIPFENAEQLYYHRKWLFRFDGQKLVSLTLPKSFVLAWGVPGSRYGRSPAIKIFLKVCQLSIVLSIFLQAKKIIKPIIPSRRNILVKYQRLKRIFSCLQMQAMDYPKPIPACSRT